MYVEDGDQKGTQERQKGDKRFAKENLASLHSQTPHANDFFEFLETVTKEEADYALPQDFVVRIIIRGVSSAVFQSEGWHVEKRRVQKEEGILFEEGGFKLFLDRQFATLAEHSGKD